MSDTLDNLTDERLAELLAIEAMVKFVEANGYTVEYMSGDPKNGYWEICVGDDVDQEIVGLGANWGGAVGCAQDRTGSWLSGVRSLYPPKSCD